MIDLSNVIALALDSDDVLQIQDAIGTVLWQKTIYYNVNISAGSNGTVSVNGVSGNYSQSVPSGTVLTIEGTGNTGYDFDEWSDGVSTNPRTITVTGDLTLTAAFESALPNYFYVENVSGSDMTVTIKKSNVSAPTVTLYKSTDRQNWTSMGSTNVSGRTAIVPTNSKLYIKSTTNAWANSSYYNYITTDTNCKVGGNIMSLLYGDNFENATNLNDYAFTLLFHNLTNLTDASDLILPSTTLSNDCYRGMFYNCTSLTTAPALPATTLTYQCYNGMFSGCSSLNSVISYAQNISATGCITDWLNGVSATGDFYNLGSATYPSGASGIPSGWTEHTSL